MTTQLLVSVRNPQEAVAALAGGADIIDVKEPTRGPLGMADLEVIAAVIEAVAARAPVSAALGEISPPAACLNTQRQAGPVAPRRPGSLPPIPNLTYVKCGLAGTNATNDWRNRLTDIFTAWSPAQPIAAAYADADRVAAPPIDHVLDWAIEHAAAGLLIDTAVKDGRTLLDWIAPDMLAQLIRRARSYGLLVALAGSLTGDAFARAVALKPDIVAVRSAACAGHDRRASVSCDKVRALAETIARHNADRLQPAG